jgi:hypothetical protein
VSRYPWGDVNAYDAFLDEEERHLWEEKVRFALYSEQARDRSDIERKWAKENPPDELADHEGLD